MVAQHHQQLGGIHGHGGKGTGRPGSSHRHQKSVGGGQYRARQHGGNARRGQEDTGVILGHRASSAGSFLGLRGGVPDEVGAPPRYYPDTAGDEAMLTLMHQLRSQLATARAESADLAEANQELRARLALLEAGGAVPLEPEPEPEPKTTCEAGGNTTEPWPGGALAAALVRIAELEAAANRPVARTPSPTQSVAVAEAGCQTVEPWLGPALAAANEQIRALESTVNSERETQIKLRETHKVWRDAHVAELEETNDRVLELEALLAASRKETEEEANRSLRLIAGLEGVKNTALLRAREAEDELARLTKAQMRAQKQQMVAQSIESVKIGIIAPKVSITFSGGGSVSASPGMPREELQRVLETEVLPKFVRILTDDSPGVTAEELALVDPASSAIPPGQNKWLHEHITLMRGAIEAQLGGVFS